MRTEVVRQALTDARSGQVVLVSHCCGTRTCVTAVARHGLERSTRWRPNCNARKWDIVQMPCPEQCAWGGVDKRYTTRVAYRRLAGQVVRDYVRSGQSVRAVVGVAGSPCGGVRTTLDLVGALDAIAGLWRSRRSQVRSAP